MELYNHIKVFFILYIVQKSSEFPRINVDSSKISNSLFQSANISGAFSKCLSEMKTNLCFRKSVIDFFDEVINDNSTWRLSDLIYVEKVVNSKPKSDTNDTDIDNINNTNNNTNDLSTILADKAKQFIESRALRFRLSPVTVQGRKKDKGLKGFNWMAAAAMLAVIAQMIMGKIAVVAGAALLFSKLALLLSFLGTIKKPAGGNSKEHVVYSEGNGGGGYHGSGWQRSIFPPIINNNDNEYDNEITQN